MKKKTILSLLLAMVLCATACLSLASCGKGENLKYYDVSLSGESYGYCVNKNDGTLLEKVNTFLNQIKKDGTLDALYAAEENHTASSIGTVKTESTNRANELVVATNAEFEPFEYKIGNEFAGIDMQVAKKLATYLNKELVIMDIDFDAVITTVGGDNAKADIGMAGLTISDKRAETVNFSTAYFGTTQYLVVRESDTTFDGVNDVTATEDENLDAKKVEFIQNKIKELNNAKAGAASGQTGYFYLKGDESLKFDGFSNLNIKTYDSIALAAKALSNGNVDFVVGDRDTVKAAVAALNK